MGSEQLQVRPIYAGGYIPRLGLVNDPRSPFDAWLVYRHPDGQWVTLANMRKHVDIVVREKADE